MWEGNKQMNVEHRTSNVQRRMKGTNVEIRMAISVSLKIVLFIPHSMFDVERSMLDVHLLNNP